MQAASASGLVDTLRHMRLLAPAQLDEIVSSLQLRFPDSKELARELLQRGWLTPYQVNLLLQGRGADLLLGSYVLLERLGDGATGTVFKARHQIMGRVVALKLIGKDRLANPDLLRRFEREVRASAQLSHPNVVRAYDAAQAGDAHYFVMEYVAGADLGRFVRENGPLPVEHACAVVHQVALGLQHAHEKGLIHRDIKPSNLLLAKAEAAQPPGLGVVKIADLGVARMLSEADADSVSSLSLGGNVLGTPDFEAPEQSRHSSRADIRADLYSVGCTFYFLLTGRPPFPDGSPCDKLVKHQQEEPEPVEKWNTRVPPSVAGVVRRLMAKRPEDRYQTPAELALALENLGYSDGQTPVGARRSWAGLLLSGLASLYRFLRRHPVLTVAVTALTAVLWLAWPRVPPPPKIHPVLAYEMRKHPPTAVEFKGHWFCFFPEKVPSWNTAKLRCQELGGYLACVRNASEQQFILTLTNGQNAWLGGSNDAQSKWSWITGEPIGDSYWAPGQPNNGPNVHLQLIGKEWHDVGRREQKGYPAGILCEWDH